VRERERERKSVEKNVCDRREEKRRLCEEEKRRVCLKERRAERRVCLWAFM
jgi:hypothetical protein